MTHDWSPLSRTCLACGQTSGPECHPSAAEPDDAEAALARYLEALEDA